MAVVDDDVWQCSQCYASNPEWHGDQCPVCGYVRYGRHAEEGWSQSRSYATRPLQEPRPTLPTPSSLFGAGAISPSTRLSPAPIIGDDGSREPRISSPLPTDPDVETTTLRVGLSREPVAVDHPGFPGTRTWQNWRGDLADTAYAYLRNPVRLPVAIITRHLFLDSILLATDRFLMSTGQLEPPLTPGKTRLRWRSNRGVALFDDVEELADGGITKLVVHIKRSSGIDVSASPYSQYAGNQQYRVPRPGRWLRSGFTRLTSAFGSASGTASSSTPSLPQHNARSAPAEATVTTQKSGSRQNLHLMACMHRDQKRKIVKQDPIEDVTTDRELLYFMRQQHVSHRGRVLGRLSLKSVKGIYLVKFWLPMGGSVDVRHHSECSTPCDCIPPPAKVEPSATAEYRCSPVPPKVWPPIPPRYLTMLFYNPTEVHEDDTWVLDQLPKRICGRLQGAPGQPAEGWGIYYQEGWDKKLIVLIVFLIFVLASLLFGVLWSVYQFDVQGAFGVSAWVATLGGILIALLIH